MGHRNHFVKIKFDIIQLSKVQITMQQPHKFPLNQFRNTMLVTSKVKKQLQPFINEFSKGNIVWMFGAISQLQRIFNSSHEDIQIKFSSIFAVKVLFDTGSVELINLIQAYLLQHLERIASYQANLNDQQKGMKYFIDLGYPSDHKQIQKFGYNYLRLAIELMIVAPKIKPKKLYENQFMRSDSQFTIAFKRLLSKGLKPYESLAYYKENLVEEIKNKFKTGLATYKDKSQKYSMYFLKCTDNFIKNGKSDQQASDFKKILATGDLFITTDIIGLCSESLGSQSFVQRKNAILLLNEFIRWGDAQAYIVINEDHFIEQIADHIMKLKVEDVSLQRGRKIYPQIKGQQAAKNQFYVQFLKCIQNWGSYFQKDLVDPNKKSKIRQILVNFKQNKKLQFPQNKGLQRFIGQTTQAFSKNKQRTERILQQCNINELPQQSQLQSKREQSKSMASQNQKQIKIAHQKQPIKRQNPSIVTPVDTPYEKIGVTYQGFMKAIKSTNLQIQAIPKSELDVQKRMDYLISFRQNFEANIEDMDQPQEQKIEQVMDQGFKVVDKITQIQTIFKKYKEKKVTWKHVCCVAQGIPYKSELQSKIDSPSKVQSNIKAQQKVQSQLSIKAQLQKSLQPKNEVNKQKFRRQVPDSNKKTQSQIKPEPKRDSMPKQSDRSDSKGIANTVKTSNIGSIQSKSNAGGSSSVDALQIQGDLKSRSYQINQNKQTKTIEIELKKQQFQQILQRSKFIEQKDSWKKINNQQQELEQFVLSKQQQSKAPKQSFSAVSISNERKSKDQFQRQTSRVRDEIQSQNVEIMPGVLNGPSKQNFSFSPSQYEKSKLRQEQVDGIGKSKFYEEHHMQSPINKNLKDINLNINLPSQAEQEDIWDGEMDEFDQIEEPDLKPLNESYHDIRQLETKIKNDPTPSFKACFESNQYLITSNKNTKKLQKLFWLEKDTANLFKPSKSNASINSGNKSSRVSIPQLLYQRSNKYNQELNKIDQQKSKHINVLQDKIKELETQGKNLKQIVGVQQRQLKVMTELNDDDLISRNQVSKYNYLEDQNYLFKSKMRLANQAVKFTPSKSNYSISLNNTAQGFNQKISDNDYSHEPQFFNAVGKLISMSAFSQYLTQYEKKQKTKKSLLKHKELACKDEGSVEIGWMTSRINNKLQIVYYITPQSADIENFSVKIQRSSQKKLDIRCQPLQIRRIGNTKQQKITIEIQINQVPYKLPSIQLSYTQNGVPIQKSFVLPCSFNKFVETKPVNRIDLERAFQANQQKIKRGQEVPYSKRILKDISKITDYIPNVSIFNGGSPNQNHEIVYGGIGRFGIQEFLFRVCIKPNQFLYIQGLNTSKTNNGALDYFICITTHLLMKQISWKN